MALETDFDTEFAGPQAWARMYRSMGWQVVPCLSPKEHVNFKRPVIDWREFEDSLADDLTFEGWYGPAGQYRSRQNMGGIAGSASGRLVVIDLDRREGKDGFAWWQGLLTVHNNGMEPETPSQRTGGGGRQLVFRAPEGWTPPTFKTRIGVDIRGQGGFFVLPPSLHDSGLEYAWEPGREPWTIEVADLPDWAREAIDKLREEFARNAGQGVERTSTPTETNAFGRVIDGREERMANIVWGVCCDLRRELGDLADPANHPTVISERERAWGLYLFEVKTRVKGETNDERGLEHEGRGRSAFDDRWNRAIAQWNAKLMWEAAVPKAAPPKPIELGGFDPWARFNVPTFPLECLPKNLREFVEYETANLGADPAGIAMAALTAVSGALDQQFRVNLRPNGNWFPPPRLWTALVGESATKKSPVIAGAIRPIRAIEAKHAADHARDEAMWEAKEKADRGAKPPPRTRFILNDTTIEAVTNILSHQHRGALVVHDELSAFIGSLDRYTSGVGDRAFWLTAHVGEAMSVDRVGRSAFVKNLCVAFLGGIQPDRLAELSDLMSDGMLQRFLPVIIDRGPGTADLPSELPALRYADLIGYVASMQPMTFLMSADALRQVYQFRDMAADIEADAESLGRAYCSWIGKLPGYFGSLSILLHVLHAKEEAPYTPISAATAQRVGIILTEFIIPHGRSFYDDVVKTAKTEELQRIGSYLLTSDQDRFTVSDLRWNSGSLLKSKNPWEFESLIAPFVSGGWLTEDGGRAWNVVPGVREKFAERRQIELDRKARIARRFTPKTELAHADQS